MSPDERTLLELIWSHFETKGRWPNERLLWYQLKNLGLDWEALAGKAAWLEEGPSYVRADLETLASLSEVRAILAPVPQLLQRLVRHFMGHREAIDDDSAKTEIGLKPDAFFPLWKDSAQAQRALWLLSEFVSRPLGMVAQSESEFSFHPRLEILRFERVETLEQVLEALKRPVVGLVRQAPEGVYLTLLEQIYARLRESAQWPRLVDLVLQLDRGQFGYVPDRLVEMMPAFIEEERDSERQLRIHLTAEALPYVAGDMGCSIALKLVHALVALLVEAGSEPPEVSIEQLAQALKLPVGQVRPVARLLEREPWCSLWPPPKHWHDWRIQLHEYPLWQLKDVKTWAEYDAAVRPMRKRYEPPPPPPKRLALRRLAASILEEAVPQQADSGSEQHAAPVDAARAAPQGGRPKVFIGHGHSEVWRELRDFLRDKLQLEPVEFNSEPTAGYHTVERLKQCLDECGMAFLVMTGEEALPDGSRQARANVIHEIGLFQGRLGFDKAVILMEEGCREFSNIAGFTRLSFPRDTIRACFEGIRDLVARRLPTGRHGAF